MSEHDQTLLQVRDLAIAFRQDGGWAQVVHGLSFDVRHGETLAIVGESGSGKSVTAMSILGLLPSSARITGTIHYNGQDLVALRDNDLRSIRGREIAMVFQEPMTALNPVYTIGQQVMGAIEAHGRIGRQAARVRALELLRLVNLPEPERKFSQFPHQLSGGQRQRAMIAMAICSEPKILIADEPTTALDVTVQSEILDLLISLQRRLGMAIVIITHDMGVVADVASRVLVMKNGKEVEAAPVDALFAAPREDYTRNLLAAVPHNRESRVETGNGSAAERVLDIADLSVHYRSAFGGPGFLAVDKVSFQVGRGQVVGLVGESGSGKSTIARAAIGLMHSESATHTLCGHDLRTRSALVRRQITRQVSMVFQDPASSLNPRATIGENVTAPLRWNGIESNGAELARTARRLLDQVSIPGDWSDRYPHELSGGQRQRVSIARAIATRPVLMVADEPTSALDVTVQATILDLLHELQQEMGFSCLFISHDLALVKLIANEVVVLRRGKVVEAGDTASVLQHPRDPYTMALVEAMPVPDPALQRAKRERRLANLTPAA